MTDGFDRRTLRHQQQSQVIVRVPAAWIESQCGAKLLLGRIEFFLRNIQIPKIVVCPR